MKTFRFRGEIPASKSILNRLLILQSHAASLDIEGDSDCDDVQDLRRGLLALDDQSVAKAGSGGTTFRFLAARASCLMGRHEITASRRLLERPQSELTDIFAQLGVNCEFHSDGCVIESEGWNKPDGPLRLSVARSSQFASAVLLNAWELPFTLDISLEGDSVSVGYLDMTRRLVEAAGMTIERVNSRWSIPPGQTVRATQLEADADVSSAFSIAALGALAGEAKILNFPRASSLCPQPDAVFVSLLEKMGASCLQTGAQLIVRKAPLRCLDADLKNAPDLFPVLATLCAFAEGTSVLHGAPQLAFKESARIEKTAELIRLLDREVEVRHDGLVIHGRPESTRAHFDFDPDQDHRLAMAAGLAMAGGASIRVTTPNVVRKSYPAYWDILQAGLK